MTYEEILAAIRSGETVYWSNVGYRVWVDAFTNKLATIFDRNGCCCGLQEIEYNQCFTTHYSPKATHISKQNIGDAYSKCNYSDWSNLYDKQHPMGVRSTRFQNYHLNNRRNFLPLLLTSGTNIRINCFDFSRDSNGNPTAHYEIWENGNLMFRSVRRRQIGYTDQQHNGAEVHVKDMLRGKQELVRITPKFTLVRTHGNNSVEYIIK